MARRLLGSEDRLELEIQQQIANYNNSLSRIYDKLQSLQNQCDEIKASEKKRFDQLESRQQAIESKISSQCDSFNENVKQLYMNKNDLLGKILKIEKNLEEHRTRLDENKELALSLNDQFCILDESIEKNEEIARLARQGHDHRLYDIEQSFKKQLSKAVNDLLNIPCKYTEIRKEFDTKLKDLKVDHDGIMKEINYHKKDAYITEKKLEHVITSLARLKGEK
jgi:uncharacterized phage infection (PIP) family protein YhgE